MNALLAQLTIIIQAAQTGVGSVIASASSTAPQPESPAIIRSRRRARITSHSAFSSSLSSAIVTQPRERRTAVTNVSAGLGTAVRITQPPIRTVQIVQPREQRKTVITSDS